jgi:hypothetical protein
MVGQSRTNHFLMVVNESPEANLVRLRLGLILVPDRIGVDRLLRFLSRRVVRNLRDCPDAGFKK